MGLPLPLPQSGTFTTDNSLKTCIMATVMDEVAKRTPDGQQQMNMLTTWTCLRLLDPARHGGATDVKLTDPLAVENTRLAACC